MATEKSPLAKTLQILQGSWSWLFVQLSDQESDLGLLSAWLPGSSPWALQELWPTT